MILTLILLIGIAEPPHGTPLQGGELERRTQAIASEIRCPVCQGLSIADSPSEMAVNMKAEVRDLVARGYTQEQIDRHFERSYGQFVLLRPKFRGVNTLVWILPIAALAAGAFLVLLTLRKLTKGALS
ncbi:MAG: cytochrome c-type biogenesis protein CcmH [Acidobacteria bacterium]|nr:MAG: cytochrome c-type biogenesis protein CcmH [Acidobacteriota bacterium]